MSKKFHRQLLVEVFPFEGKALDTSGILLLEIILEITGACLQIGIFHPSCFHGTMWYSPKCSSWRLVMPYTTERISRIRQLIHNLHPWRWAAHLLKKQQNEQKYSLANIHKQLDKWSRSFDFVFIEEERIWLGGRAHEIMCSSPRIYK